MIICEVTGHVWATKKERSLEGLKLMVVRKCGDASMVESDLVAADLVGAGIGEHVLVVSGSTARIATGSGQTSVDAAIVGIIDSLEVSRESAKNK